MLSWRALRPFFSNLAFFFSIFFVCLASKEMEDLARPVRAGLGDAELVALELGGRGERVGSDDGLRLAGLVVGDDVLLGEG
jgi:hypothetical protein